MARQVVTHYEIIEKIGEGGMGVVYRAQDRRLSRYVALKFLPQRLLGSEDARRRFFEEARAISALNHPNIAVLYELSEDEDAPFLVFEYLPGGTLRSRIRELSLAGVALSVDDIAGYGAQIAGALGYAHRRDIIHRDVKSENVLFTESGTLKVSDFGLARYLGAPAEAGLSGTVSYMSPEQAQGLPVDHRTDIFSLGILLYEMATAELPFRGKDEDDVLEQIVHAPTPPVRRLRPDLPEDFERIVGRATAKRPEDRYATMEQLAGDLATLAEDRSAASGHLANSWAPTLELKPASGRATSIPRRAVWKPAGALLALAAALILGWFSRGRSDAIPSEKQIAVLPFTNIGGDPANAPFCDGLMETLTSRLTQLEQFEEPLRVVAASEVRKEGTASAREAHRAFGATLALTGSVQRSGDAVRLTANLVDTASLRQLRTRTIDTRIGDAAVLQDGVVAAVAQMLELELRPAARSLLEAGGTRLGTAYDSYVQGLGHLARYDRAENIDSAILLFQQAIRQDPVYALAHAGLGEALWRKYQLTRDAKHIEEAQRSSARALELASGLAHLHVTRGLILTGTGRYEDAVHNFRRALELDPVNAAAYRNLGWAYQRLGRNRDAELTLRRAIELRSNDWAGHKELGVFYSQIGRYEDAARCFLRVVELTPDNYSGYRNLGGLYYLLSRYDEAIAMNEKSIAIRPTGAAYSNLGTIYFFQARYADAARAFEKAVAAAAQDRRLWGNLGDAYLRVQPAKAEDAYRRALDLVTRDLAVNPKDAEARADRGVYLARVLDRERALPEINQARRLAPGNLNILFKSALICELSGRRNSAIKLLKSALEGGYSAAEIERHPDLAELRRDPRFKTQMKGER